jgi:hypothetical protein
MTKGKISKNKEKRTVVSNKKKDRDQFKKEMDMILLKKKIEEIMKKTSDDKSAIKTYNIKYEKNVQLINEKYTDNSLYQNMFQNYLKNEFTLICISIINKIALNIKHNHLEQFEAKYNFNKIFIDLAKELLLNEYELILLSLYLEYINISLYLDIFTMEESLLYLCFFIKKLTLEDEELEPILHYLNKIYNNFEINYEKWFKVNENKINSRTFFHYKDVNKRFREYNIPFSKYCRDNYIDYNYIVDRILTMSLPYADIKKENNLNKDNNLNKINRENTYISNKSLENSDDNDINKIKDENIYISNKNSETEKDNKNKEINSININKLNTNYIIINRDNINMKLNSNLNAEAKNNIKTQINNTNFNPNNNNKIYQTITPNILLHSLSNNKYRVNSINDETMLNSNLNKNFNRGPNYIYLNDNYTYNHQEINEQNIRNQTRQNEVDFIPKKINSGLLLNPIQSPSQSSLIFQQKPSLTDLNLLNKNNNNVSGIFYDEGDELKIILKNSNDNNYFRSSLSFETQKYPYELFLGNYTNSNMNINNSTKNISHNKISYNNMNTNLKQNNNNAPFKPLNIYYNKNFIKNIVNPNIIYNNNNNINYENKSNDLNKNGREN